MSLIFNDTTNKKGLVQMYERECGFADGEVSGSTTRLKQFTAEANLALDDFFAIALPASGRWQLDDSNQTDYPIIRTNIQSGVRDYPFTTDGSSNLILDVLRVRILTSATATDYTEIKPVDDPSEMLSDFDSTRTGVPTTYDKLGNAIRFGILPSYNATNGLEMHISREASYFTYTDLTKKPGVPGLFHKYFFLKPSLVYTRRNNDIVAYDRIKKDIDLLEGVPDRRLIGSIEKYFSHRAQDERPTLTPRLTPYI